jgi:hypothetical protein
MTLGGRFFVHGLRGYWWRIQSHCEVEGLVPRGLGLSYVVLAAAGQ